MSGMIVRIDVELPANYAYSVANDATESVSPPLGDAHIHIPPGQTNEYIALTNKSLANFIMKLTSDQPKLTQCEQHELQNILTERVFKLSKISEVLALVEHQFRELLYNATLKNFPTNGNPLDTVVPIEDSPVYSPPDDSCA